MFVTKFKSALAMLLVVGLFAGGVITLECYGATGQQPDAKKDTAKSQDQPENKTDQKPPAKNADAKKPADPFHFDDLKVRLKKHEVEIASIRQAMLKEIADEEQKLSEAIKKEQDAQKAGDRAAFFRAAKLQAKKSQLSSLRFQVQSGVRSAGNLPALLSMEQRLGIHVNVPNTTIAKQLGLAKDQGLVLEKVDADSPASKAGLKAHDILLKLAGKTVPSDKKEFHKILAGMKADTPVEVVVLREGKEQTIQGLVLPTGAAPTAGAK